MITAHQPGLIFATLIGIAFGFVLERAGFGRADKLAAQFYLRDLRVFKVMFSAIVTAMLGLMIAGGFGLVNLREVSESIASFTWIWPMIIGGFVLGIGFIVSGYCPGTSVVAAGSGNVDGYFTVAGVITGTFVYTKLLAIPSFQHFHESSARGSWFLYDLVKVPPQAIAAAVTVMAVLAFIGAEKVERVVSGAKDPGGSGAEDPSPSVRLRMSRRVAFAALGTLALVALITIAIPSAPAVASQRVRTISAAELARIVVDEPWSVRVIDTRDAAAFAKERVPGSQNLSAADLDDLPDDGREIVIVGNAADLPPKARMLAGGMSAWNADPLVKAMTSGAPPPPPAPSGAVIAKPKKKGGGCSA